MILLDNQHKFKLDLEKLENIAKTQTKKDIELLLVNEKAMQKLNKTYRNQNYPTDVLSFPLSDMPHTPLGTIIINIDMAKTISTELKHSQHDEISLLFIHGLLHLLGYDHEQDSGEMREKEKYLIEKFSLPKSLIVRSE